MDLDAIIDRDFEARVAELKEWIRIPSVSALPEFHGEVVRSAAWAAGQLKGMGFPKAEVVKTETLPLVYGEWCPYPGKPTLLIYGHCDVQPPDPLAQWVSPPFEPVAREGKLYARGANDNKGQSMCWMGACKALLARDGKLPINVKVLMECEEEVGGTAIARHVAAHAEALACDAVLVVDTPMPGADKPAICVSLRGLVYTEITVTGARTDMHSGQYGGVAPNPIQALALLLARLKGEDGIIQIPELMAAIPDVTAEETAAWAADVLHYGDSLKEQMGTGQLFGQNGVSPYARVGLYPTLEVHGIRGGFVGEGAKTVIPASAVAKVSLRLPPGVSAKPVAGWFEAAVRKQLPKGFGVEVKVLSTGEGMNVAWDAPAMKLARDAMAEVYGKPPLPMRMGGSIPVCADFARHLKVPVLLVGFGLPDDDLHAPNEKYDLAQLKQGMRVIGRLVVKLSLL
jgi:acetylornithine deacetylase/succinyl-diaminopimelate desuccinylase-like protein